MLYLHGPPSLVNSYSHDQVVQAVTHHVAKRDKSCIQPPVKHNRMGNWFGIYPEVNSDEDISCKDFTHETPGRLSMTAGLTKQDLFKWSRIGNRANEPYQHDQMSD